MAFSISTSLKELEEELAVIKAAQTPAAPLKTAVTPGLAAVEAPAKTLLDYALDCQRRGWFVLPCYPRSKAPAGNVVPHGLLEASNDESVIRAWWATESNFNPAISLGPSNLVVYDFDSIKPFDSIPPTFTVKTGRADKNGIAGIQMYYTGSCKTHGHAGGGGEVRSRGSYAMAPGAIHPSGNPYTIISDIMLAQSPEQNESTCKPTAEAIGTDEQMTIAAYVGAAFDVSGVGYESAIPYNGGFKWFIICPWTLEHTEGKDFDTSSAVIMWPSGKLIYECKHGHCLGVRQWKQLREWMETTVGHYLVFGEPTGGVLFGKTSEPESIHEEPVPPASVKQSVTVNGKKSHAFVFESEEDKTIASSLGLDAHLLSEDGLQDHYYRLIIFGNAKTCSAYAAKIGAGANVMRLPKDKTKAKKYTACLADAVRQYTAQELVNHFERIADLEAVKRSFTDTDDKEVYDMTPEEFQRQKKSKHPVYKLHEPPGPSFNPNDMYGVLGDVVRKIGVYNESDMGSMYMNLLVSFGNMMGRHVYFTVNETRHYTNEYLLCIGDSSVTRKGTGSDAVNSLLFLIDPDWSVKRNMGGFSTAQAIVSEIKDPAPTRRKNSQGAEVTSMVPGVTDKRLCIREDEASALLKMETDKSSYARAGVTIRNGWDGKALQNRVKGQTVTGEPMSVTCREPMMSIIGYMTPSLLRENMPEGWDRSGSGNRFLFWHMKRLQLVTRGGPAVNWTDQVYCRVDGHTVSIYSWLRDAIAEAGHDREILLSPDADDYWDSLYLDLEAPSSKNRKKGRVSGLTKRGVPHIKRMAMILALLDRSTLIELVHLKAAVKLWQCSLSSVKYLFLPYDHSQERLLKLMSSKQEGINVADGYLLFNRNKSHQWVQANLQVLVDGGFATLAGETYKFKRWGTTN